MFLYFFTILLILLNVYFFFKKKYLYLFIPCMLFLPEYYGIEISNSLPIVSATRIMCVVFYTYSLLNRRRNISIKRIHIKEIPTEFLFLAGFFVFRIFSNLYYIATYGQAIKAIISIIFEHLFFFIAIYIVAPTKDEIITLLKTTVWSSVALFAVGVLESYFFIRPFDALYTVSRPMLNDHYIRLGLLRSTTTMGLPNFFGNACILVLPLIMYLYWSTYKKRYLFCILVTIFAIIHSGSRSDLLFLIILLGIHSIYIIKKKELRFLFIKNFCIILASVLLIIGILSFLSPYYKYYYVGTAKSILNTFGLEYDLDANAPYGVDGYGKNEAGTYSRLFQFSGIEHALKTNALFGLGAGCEQRGEIRYKYKGKWINSSLLDVGYVQIICLEGIIGLLGYLSLWVSYSLIILRYFRSNNTFPPNGITLLLLVLAYLLCLLSAANMPSFISLITALHILCRLNSNTLQKESD